LTVTGPAGSDTETKTDYISVAAGGPVAEFSADKTSASGYTGDTSLTVNFTDESTGEVTAWSWDFDGDDVEDSADQNPTYTYSGFTGKKTVKLTVTGPDGSDSETKTDYVRIIPAANRIYVSVKTGNDADSGATWALAKKTIQAGINVASDDYAVLVAKGTYSTTGNYNLDFGGKKIHLKGVTAGATDDQGTDWIIDGLNTTGRRGLIFQTSEGAHSVVDNFTIQKCIAPSTEDGGGIYCSGASPTIINCRIAGAGNRGDNGGGIYLEAGSNAIITDCTIKSNQATSGDGGGICCINSSPRITNCTIGASGQANTATNCGGGVYCLTSNPRITNCTIEGNSVTWWGGGIYSSGSSLLITSCTIKENVASDCGGGIYLFTGSNATITGCTICGNSATYWGGGIYCESSTPTIMGCTIGGDLGGNSAGDLGGGICLYKSSPKVINCVITNNAAVVVGGAIECWNECSPAITNCLIANNSTTTSEPGIGSGEGGGVDCYYNCSPTMSNCTIASNTAANDGGGISCYISTPVLNNTILWGNTASGSGNQIYTWTTGATCTVTLNYSDYADNTLDPNNIAGSGTWTASNCIVSDPVFLDASAGDYHLQATSPCIDTGSNALVPAGITVDLEGNPRIAGSAVDMGAYEYQP
jgi:parallel beta-helix repeat protein